MDEVVFRRVELRDYLKRFLSKGVRPDGRALTTPRKLTLTTGSISSAVGSAMLKLGRTTAVAGIQACAVAPSSSAPDVGVVDVSVDILATATSNYRNLRASDDALVLARAIRRCIEPHVDVRALCIAPGKLVWALRLTVYCVDHDGNLEDAALLAAVAALRDVRLPSVRVADDGADDGDGNSMPRNADGVGKVGRHGHVGVASAERTVALRMEGMPLTVTFALIDDMAVMDATAEEEAVADSKLTLVMHENGTLRGVNKAGGRHLPETLLQSCLQLAQSRALTLRAKLSQTAV